MSTFLFDNFKGTSPTAWKQKIQVDLKGADYNETLLWKTNDGLTVKPFYTKEDRTNTEINLPNNSFKTCQTIFIGDEKTTNTFALNSLKRGATALQFVANSKFDFKTLLKNIQPKEILIYFKFNFLDTSFTKKISTFINSKTCYFQIDIIGNFAESGNWFINLKEDHKKLDNIVNFAKNSISVSGDLYQNSGANNIQQLAYTLAHANEYLNYFDASVATKIHFQFSVGGNYFHEIAKLRAFRLLWSSLLKEYNIEEKKGAHLFVQPSLRNKTVYDYNVNMLRTTSECMSAILGGANTISNISYNAMYAKQHDFGERIGRNQLLILQEESRFKEAQNFANGAYYIESLTQQMAEKALIIFKQIEKGGGFVKQLKEGNIQKKTKKTALEEEAQFAKKELVLLGINLQANKQDFMQNNLEINPFVKKRNVKTLISPLIRKRLSENHEKQRLKNESNFS